MALDRTTLGAEPAGISAGWRTLTTAEETRADWLIDAAIAKINREYPAADALATNVVKGIVLTMVWDALNAPKRGVTSTARSTGPYSLSASYGPDAAGQALTFEDWMIDVLAGGVTEGKTGWLA